MCVYQEMDGKNHHGYQECSGLWPSEGPGQEKEAAQILPEQQIQTLVATSLLLMNSLCGQHLQPPMDWQGVGFGYES